MGHPRATCASSGREMPPGLNFLSFCRLFFCSLVAPQRYLRRRRMAPGASPRHCRVSCALSGPPGACGLNFFLSYPFFLLRAGIRMHHDFLCAILWPDVSLTLSCSEPWRLLETVGPFPLFFLNECLQGLMPRLWSWETEQTLNTVSSRLSHP